MRSCATFGRTAEQAARRLGVDARAIVAQAALESGWGQHVMQRENGSSSFNLFGIKASGGWDGNSVIRPTLEFRDGVASREHAKFRAYDSLAQAFDDYASFLGGRARYADASTPATMALRLRADSRPAVTRPILITRSRLIASCPGKLCRKR